MKNTYIVIPALKPGPGLAGEIRELGRRLCARIVLVDDGSGLDYQKTFALAERVEGCRVLYHRKNLGKGRALKTGFAYIKGQLLEEKALILCMDCDGQHLPADGAGLLLLAERWPGSLILGVRDFSGAGVPLRSRLGNRIASRALCLASGIRIRDTQTGLRAFDSSLLERFLEVPGEGFDYEMAMLLTCAREGIPVRTRKIRTVYVKGNAGSHFRPLTDSLLVLAACLRRERS